MNWLKRALLSLWGHKGRSVLLVLVFSVIATLIFSSMVIHSTSQQEIKQAKQTVCASVTLRAKPEKDATGGTSYGATPLSLANKFCKLNNVINYNYDCSIDMMFKNVQFLGDKGIYESQEQQIHDEFGAHAPGGVLYGETDTRKSVAFTSAGYKLIEGRPITTEDQNKPNALINQQLAQKNNLKIGDKITISTVDAGFKHEEEMLINFRIVGIYSSPSMDSSYVDRFAMENPGNFVFCSDTETLKLFRYVSKSEDYVGVASATYYLDDPAHVSSFKAAVIKQLDTSKYELLTDESWYNHLAGPLQNTEKMANLITLLVTLAGCAILVLVIMLLQKDRRREYGILLAVGEKRWRILAQIFVEIFIPAILAFLVTAGASSAVGRVAGNALLVDRVKAASAEIDMQNTEELTQEGYSGGRAPRDEFYTRSKTLVQAIDQININLQPDDYITFAEIGFGLIILSVGASAIPVLRLAPYRMLGRRE